MVIMFLVFSLVDEVIKLWQNVRHSDVARVDKVIGEYKKRYRKNALMRILR